MYAAVAKLQLASKKECTRITNFLVASSFLCIHSLKNEVEQHKNIVKSKPMAYHISFRLTNSSDSDYSKIFPFHSSVIDLV